MIYRVTIDRGPRFSLLLEAPSRQDVVRLVLAMAERYHDPDRETRIVEITEEHPVLDPHHRA